ncbi:hypothetical protein ACFL3H_09370 [Gemmatimonadota bacterium]
MRRALPFNILLSLSTVLVLAACGGRSQPADEIPDSEIEASVPELTAMHDLVYPLWHTAFPEKDYDLIAELVPQFEEGMTTLETIELPGILREKQAAWDEGYAQLKETYASLKTATDDMDQAGMLEHTETFHMDYEKLVRVIRPLVAELDAFHQEMYKLYHYYMPAYDLEKIREAVAAMEVRLVALGEAELSGNLAEKQADFDTAVTELAAQVAALAEQLNNPSKRAVTAAIEIVHTAYAGAEKIFD